LAVIVSLGGFASLAVVSATAAQAATTTTVTPADTLCPAGTKIPAGTKNPLVYCQYYCPSGTLVSQYSTASGTVNIGEYCESSSGSSSTSTSTTVSSAGTTVLPQGPPTEFDAVLWGTKFKLVPLTSFGQAIKGKFPTGYILNSVTPKGPDLKFHIKSGINGAPLLKSLTLKLPKGLSFTKQELTLAVNGPERFVNSNTLRLVFRGGGVASFLVYLKKHSMLETLALRNALSSGKIKKLTFGLTVTDVSGRSTALSFSVPPNS
jgi:hypothetical protein